MVYALILIVVVLINNAPALRGVVDRLDIRKLFNKLFKKKHDPAVIKDDETDWTRIESKIKMDEILTVDIRDKESQSDGEDTDNG